MDKIIEMPKALNIDYTSYSFLAKLQNTIIDSDCDCIILDFQKCKFSNAAFTALLGALTEIANCFGKSIIYRAEKDSDILKYFKRSGLYNYLKEDSTDYHASNAIPFHKINMDDDYIIDYIDNILKLAPIQLTTNCHDVLFKNIYEIFNNSTDHSRAQFGVFSCGHWMPTKKQLVFSVYDTGIGIPALVKEKIDSSLSSADALEWALVRGHSTKQLTNGIPRGLGLSDLFDFIKLNHGALNIMTNDLYYQYNGSKTIQPINHPIIGTLISITIIADYDHVYILKK